MSMRVQVPMTDHSSKSQSDAELQWKCRCFQNRKPPRTLTHTNDRNDILWNFAMSDHRNILYFLLGILTAAVIVLGYNFYQAKRQPNGVQINLGPNGLKIEGK
ncbi:MAG: hypothetical protein E6501_01450 [Bradyrhizobium sp.]|nr:hypothetical protein [Bradyrhizobium sp.]MDU6135136.1 hypothetical protein [Bradyrhizobium sp.]MDU6375012.1 hypothetical protein [Bradyrhizobium sp.]MDU6667274.1 hypothetical protein [Bradyrhizobium sp.]